MMATPRRRQNPNANAAPTGKSKKATPRRRRDTIAPRPNRHLRRRARSRDFRRASRLMDSKRIGRSNTRHSRGVCPAPRSRFPTPILMALLSCLLRAIRPLFGLVRAIDAGLVMNFRQRNAGRRRFCATNATNVRNSRLCSADRRRRSIWLLPNSRFRTTHRGANVPSL